MRAAIYARVSTTEQSEEGFSIEGQKRRLLAYAESQDWNVMGFYIDEGISAKDLNRPQLKRMLDDIRNGHVDIVLVYKLDRLTRSAADCDHLLKMFEAHKVMFQSATESFETRTATGRLFIRLISDLAQWERELISERVRFGMEQKVHEGKKPGGKYPYGYDKNGNLIPEEEEVISRLRDMYVNERMSYKKIAVRLMTEGIQRRGHEWTSNTVALTLENPFYAGIIRFGTKLPNGKYAQRKRDERVEVIDAPGDHEAIWSLDQYNEHVQLMRSRSDGGFSRKLDYLFTGLLRCGRCGASMYGRLSSARSRKSGDIVRTPYYWCSNRKANDSCKMPMFRQSHVEHLLFEYIEKILFDPGLTQEAMQQKKTKKQNGEKELARLKRDLEAVKTRIKKWQYMFVNDLISSDDLRERLNEEAEAESKLKEAIKRLASVDKETDEVRTQLQQMADVWPELDDAEKQELLRIMFERITIYTDLENVKGVKNKFFDASIEVKYR